MKYVCLGYHDEKMWDGMSESQQEQFMDICFEYDEELQRKGHWVGGEALEASTQAATLRFRNGEVAVTDGPFAETKEQLGGILILEARDLNHAIQLMSNHPGVRMGSTFEIRPAADISAFVAESKQRRKNLASLR